MEERGKGPHIGRGERIAFGVLVAIAWAYVIIRAFAVPFVHDEARTFFLYNAVGSFQPWYCFPDAANHLLNTALGQVSYLLFGPAAWSLRLFNVLSFVVYAWYVGRLGTLIERRVVRWCLWLALLFLPFGIEFFSLYRGYGLSMAFLVMALYHLLRFSGTGRYLHVLGTLAGLLLAAYANFSLLVLWCAVLAQLAFLFARTAVPVREHLWRWASWVVLGFLPLAYLAAYAVELADQGALYYGTDQGLLGGTLISLCLSWFASDAPWLVASIAILVGVVIVQGVIMGVRDPRAIGRAPLTVLVYLLVAEVTGRCVLGAGLGMSYPMDRTALHLFLLVPLLVAFGSDAAAVRAPWMRWGAVVLLVLPVRSIVHMDRTTSWPEQSIGEDLFDEVERHPHLEGRPPMIGTTHFLTMPWALRNMSRVPALPPAQEMAPGSDGADLLLVPEQELAQFPGYHVLRKAGEVLLCERDLPQRTAFLLDTLLPPREVPGEFVTLWEMPTDTTRATALLVEVEAVLVSRDPLDAWLVCSADRAAEAAAVPTHLELLQARTRWRHDTLRVERWIPLTGTRPGVTYVRIWNKGRKPFTIDRCRLRIHRVPRPDGGPSPLGSSGEQAFVPTSRTHAGPLVMAW